MKRLGSLIVVLSILATLGLWAGGTREADPAAGAGRAAAEAKRELRVTFAWPTYIDPAVGSDFSSSSSFVNLYDTLVYPTANGQGVPHLAERWEASQDGLTWTFYLRKGVKSHDGSELTAEDVVFSMDRLITIGEGYGYLFAGRVRELFPACPPGREGAIAEHACLKHSDRIGRSAHGRSLDGQVVGLAAAPC